MDDLEARLSATVREAVGDALDDLRAQQITANLFIPEGQCPPNPDDVLRHFGNVWRDRVRRSAWLRGMRAGEITTEVNPADDDPAGLGWKGMLIRVAVEFVEREP